MRTYACTNCGASLATSAPPGTTIDCQNCNTPFLVPAPSLDQPGDSQATVVANFNRRGNPSPMPPTGPDGTPPSTPDLPPAPDSPAGVGYTVDADAAHPLVEPGLGDPVADSPVAAVVETPVAAAAGTPEPAPELSVTPEALPTPELAEDQPAPLDLGTPEPVVEPPVVPEVGTPAEEPAPVEPTASEMSAPEPVPVPVAPVVNEASAPPITPARPAGSNRTPMLIGGAVLLLCCLLSTCVFIFAVVPTLLSMMGGS